MAKSFGEISRKAENLIEQGNEADKRVQGCQAAVSAANARVAAASRMVSIAASMVDSEGNPIGDVAGAQAQLAMAQGQLAASQRALSSAQGEANRVRQQKNAHIHEIETHNKIEQSNLEKIRKLKSLAFGENASAMADGIAQRHNQAEDARVALLKSMGMEATPDYVDAGSADSASIGGGLSLSSLDTSGQAMSYKGGNSSEGALGGGVAAPVGGGLTDSSLTSGANDMISSDQESSGDIETFSIPGNTVQNGTDSANESASVMPHAVSENESYATGQGYSEEVKSIDQMMEAYTKVDNTCASTGWNGRPRTPNEILSDMKKSIRENWMNNFNADDWKRILPEKLYAERLELYRKGIAIEIGEENSKKLTREDLEQLSRVQNRSYLAGCNLSSEEVSELYRHAVDHQGNFVTRAIERKMDNNLRETAHGFLKSDTCNETMWYKLDKEEKKQVLTTLLSEMNSLFGTNVNSKIDFYYEESGSRGAYVHGSNTVRLNEYVLEKPNSFQLAQTVIHEMRHAYQHYSIESEKQVLVSSETISKWRENVKYENYKSPQKGNTFEEYLAQPIEWDAKNFAKQCSELAGIIPEYEGSWKCGGE